MIEPIRHFSWAVLVVPVMKQDGNIQLCGDFKIMLNKAVKPNIYHLTHTDELSPYSIMNYNSGS